MLDPSGGPVANAKVTLDDVDRGMRNSAQTDRSGRYVYAALSPGNYSLVVEAAGFDPYELGNIVIEVNASLSADARLRVASRRESILVQTEAPNAQTENATIGLVLDRKSINDLPLVSRNPFDLAFLAPGVSQATGMAYGNGVGTPGFVTNFVSDGSRNAQADLLLDGVSITNSDNNPGVQKALYVPPVEAIEEFKIQQANFSAEFGNSGGTIVNVITRSGTNRYHGELYEYLRNSDLNANGFFPMPPASRSRILHATISAGQSAGPFRRTKLFSFSTSTGFAR